MSSRKKVVITGASGFLGSHLVEALKDDESYEVFALSSKPDDLKTKIGGERVQYFSKEALRTEILKDAIVVNCAYPRNSTGTAIADGLRYIQRVFENAVEDGASAIINISSQSVYSQQRTEAATEDTAVCLESPYAVGKYAVELMLESICRGSATKYTNLRMASLIGPGFDQRIVNRLAKQAYSGEPLQINISNRRFGFLDIEDAVRAIKALIDKADIFWKPAYTVGNAEAYSIKEIAESVKSVFDKYRLAFPEVNTMQGEESGNTAVDYHQISSDTGFIPCYSLEETIQRIVTAFMV